LSKFPIATGIILEVSRMLTMSLERYNMAVIPSQKRFPLCDRLSVSSLCRQGTFDGVGVSNSSPSASQNTTSGTGPNILMPRSVSERRNIRLQPNSPTEDHGRDASKNLGNKMPLFSSPKY
ncbi:hypothetical protein Tco_1340922, partial [Tanacetum coccineum]